MLKDVPSRNLANANIAKEAFAAGNGKVFIEAISRIDVSDLSALDVFNVDVEGFESPAAKDSMRLATLASVAAAEDKDVAEALNNLAIVEKLVEHGTPVNVCNKSKQTPLTLAIQGKDERVLKYLLGHGADANGPGKHALKLARKLHLTNVESLLVMNGAREKPRKQHGSKLVEKGNQERLEVKRRRSEEQKLAPAGKCLTCGAVEGLLALIPCGHAVVCEACAPVLLKRTAQCPVCGLSFFATKKA